MGIKIDPKTLTFDALDRFALVEALKAHRGVMERRKADVRRAIRTHGDTPGRRRKLDTIEMDDARAQDLIERLDAAGRLP